MPLERRWQDYLDSWVIEAKAPCEPEEVDLFILAIAAELDRLRPIEAAAARAEGLAERVAARDAIWEKIVAVRARMVRVSHEWETRDTTPHMRALESEEASLRVALAANTEEGKVIHCESCGFEVKG